MTGPATITLAAHGKRHEALSAGAGDETVLLVHGFPDLPRTFRRQLPAFAAAGYRAVAPVLRGYTADARPTDGHYDVESLADDVIAWVDALGLARVHLVGHDWGAVAAYAAAAKAPQRFKTLTALAIPPLSGFVRAVLKHPRRLRTLGYIGLFQLGALAEHVFARDDFAMIDRLWAQWSPGYEPEPEEMEAIKEAFRSPGTAAAALAYYRQLGSVWRPSTVLSHALLQRPIPVSTLVVYGDRDGCMPTDVFPETLTPATFPEGIVLKLLYGAGHFLHLERPGVVNEWLLSHFARVPHPV